MSLCKFFKIMGVVTILALTYIHMQMQIIDLAYQGNIKEQKIKRLIEENGNVTYKILILKSANHLGGTMLEANSGMQFADNNDVIHIAASEEFLVENQLAEPQLEEKTNPLLSLLSFGGEAEAKSAE